MSSPLVKLSKAVVYMIYISDVDHVDLPACNQCQQNLHSRPTEVLLLVLVVLGPAGYLRLPDYSASDVITTNTSTYS